MTAWLALVGALLMLPAAVGVKRPAVRVVCWLAVLANLALFLLAVTS